MSADPIDGDPNLLTLYGRKTVQEILQTDMQASRLHVLDSLRESESVRRLVKLALAKGIDVQEHDRRRLSFISGNARQDQGVALDVPAPGFGSLSDLPRGPCRLMALDGITNPQNLGMIVRSVAAASGCHGLILPDRGNARLGPLVYKASAGNLLKTNIYRCEHLDHALDELIDLGFCLYGLCGDGSTSLNDLRPVEHSVFILGNESNGLSESTIASCHELIHIPMANGVESLNVAAAATLVAFHCNGTN